MTICIVGYERARWGSRQSFMRVRSDWERSEMVAL